MSQFIESLRSLKNGQAFEEGEWPKFTETYPNLSACIQGVRNVEGQWEIGPASVTIWVEDGKAKFCLNPKPSSKICFGMVDDPLSPFESIERALVEGKFDWKLRGRRS